jgi:hypothetical protein
MASAYNPDHDHTEADDRIRRYFARRTHAKPANGSGPPNHEPSGERIGGSHQGRASQGNGPRPSNGNGEQRRDRPIRKS